MDEAPQAVVVTAEPAVRGFVARTLERMGMHVVAAGSAEEALDAVGEGERRIDLLFTEEALPGLSQHELAEALRRAGGSLAVIVAGGRGAPGDGRVVRTGDRSVAIPRPYSLADLTRAISLVLDEGSGPGA